MITYSKRIVSLLIPMMFISCTTIGHRQSLGSAFELIYPDQSIPERINTGSIMDNGVRLYPSSRLHQSGHLSVGDIVTVLLNESAQASRSSGLTAERETTNNILGINQANAILPRSSFFDDISASGSSVSSNGGGSTDQSAELTGSISAVVVDVMQNGNLVILGEKQLTLTEGTEVIRVRGVIRPEDIQPNNTVMSRRIANAQFSYSGSGDLARATRPSIGIRTLFSLWPF